MSGWVNYGSAGDNATQLTMVSTVPMIKVGSVRVIVSGRCTTLLFTIILYHSDTKSITRYGSYTQLYPIPDKIARRAPIA